MAASAARRGNEQSLAQANVLAKSPDYSIAFVQVQLGR
jgi:hypothetical protein